MSFHDADIAEEKQNCLDSEQATRDELAKEWSGFAPADKTACTNEARMGGESSYTELLTCLEMARDVRAMQSDQAQALDHAGCGERGAGCSKAEALKSANSRSAFR